MVLVVGGKADGIELTAVFTSEVLFLLFLESRRIIGG